ncbi:ModD protein [Aquabacter cavernae]|uniref:ModD protein n=1 Tax=Aquabacter cavernae TaxID=2496029 RepID=UPI000F8DB856|nr:ModD protein [Aquabacter cavernae]
MYFPERLADTLLDEDVPHGDLTTHLLGIGDRPARMDFTLRRDGVVCGTELALALVRRAGAEGAVLSPTGARVPAGGALLRAQGSAGAILAAWKVAQTAVEYLSGIATATAAIVDAARAVAPGIAVVTTRKTFPGTKRLMIPAIRAGGAEPHRLGLSETVLVFPEHRVFLDDPVAALVALRRAAPEKKVVVEITSREEAERFAPAAPDILQCEKMSPEAVADLVAALRARGAASLVAVAGGVVAANAAAYAATGADILVTSAPYSAAPADVRVEIRPA